MKKVPVVAHTGLVRLFGRGMDHLHNISIFEEQLAGWAFTSLPFQESCDPQRHFRVFAQPRAPIEPIAIVGTAASLHFHMSPNRSAAVPV